MLTPQPYRRPTYGQLVRILYAKSTAVKAGPGGKLVSAKSKTSNTACSVSASKWRRKEASHEDFVVLAQCRAHAASLNAANLHRIAGNEAHAQHIESIIDSGLITKKSRNEKAKSVKELLAKVRAERDARKVKVAEPEPEPDKSEDTAPAVVHASSETPREAAAKETAAQLADESEYAYARKSAVSNAGEDLKDSARHTRNAWRGLADAEKQGTAEKLITRDSLMKLEPPNFSAGLSPTNALGTLAAYLALKKFAAKPLAELRIPSYIKAVPMTAEETRKAYYDAYSEIKGEAEKAAKEETDPGIVLRRVTAKTRELLDRWTKSHSYSPIRETLRQSYNAMVGGGATSPRGQINDFAKRLMAGQQGPVTSEALYRATPHVADILEGKSFNEAFNTKGAKKGGEFSPADLYTGKAERVGGRNIETHTKTSAAATKFMTGDLGMRGVQFGNSMTDDEREHHLKFAAESFSDLADVLGLPDDVMSMKGVLGVAFGARGHGTAMAHYEPDLKVINLTRKNGVGTLAHEWGHFFDNTLGVQRRGHPDTYFSEFADRSHNLVRENGEWKNTPLPQDEITVAYKEWRTSMKPFKERFQKWFSTEQGKQSVTIAKRDYWRSDREVFARAFENYISHKLEADGRKNTYLTAGVSHPLWPTKEETESMAPAFDKIFAAYKKLHGG